MENQALSDAHRALGIANALKVAVAALAATHPRPDELKEFLSGVFSRAALPGEQFDQSPAAREGWNEVLAILQDALGGFPVIAEIGAKQSPG